MTYTYAILDISEAAYAEIRAKLEEAGYTHAFHDHEPEVIDMHGIAVRSEEAVMAYKGGKKMGGSKKGGKRGC